MKIRLKIKHGCGHSAAHTFTGPNAPEWEQFVRGPEATRIASFVCPVCQLKVAKLETNALEVFRHDGQIVIRSAGHPKTICADSRKFKFVAVLSWLTNDGPQSFNAAVAKRVRVGTRPGPLCVVSACLKIKDTTDAK